MKQNVVEETIQTELNEESCSVWTFATPQLDFQGAVRRIKNDTPRGWRLRSVDLTHAPVPLTEGGELVAGMVEWLSSIFYSQ